MYQIVDESIHGYTVEELESVMSLNEAAQWREFYKIKAEERKKQQKKAKQKGKV